VASRIASASPAEVTLATRTLQAVKQPESDRALPVIADRAYDSDALRDELAGDNWDLICPHRRGRKRPKRQDGRKLRRYRRRFTIERTFAWLGHFRRLLVRHEYYSFIYHAFIKLGCLMIFLRRF
jgi:transposase